MKNNLIENIQNARFFRIDGQLRYHIGRRRRDYGVNSSEKSPETKELGGRIELARPVAIRPQWNRNLGRQIYLPSKPEEDERRKSTG